MYKLLTTKQCSCGAIHTTVKYPAVLGLASGLLWFNCKCHSTLVVKQELTKEVI